MIIPSFLGRTIPIYNRARRIMEDCDRNHISILLKNDVRYPEHAKSLEDVHAVLFYKGELRELQESVAVVGARRCTQEEKHQAVVLAQQCMGRAYYCDCTR